jgi:hypothetical protein
MIAITHTHEGGTMIEGSRRGDGVWEILQGLHDIEKLEAEGRQVQRRLDGTGTFMNFGTPASGGWRERLLVRREEIARGARLLA